MPVALPARLRCALAATRPTSPLAFVRCSVVSVSGQGGVPPCPSCTRLSRGYRCAHGVHPLRPPAALLHNAPLPSVAASHCAKAPFGVAHRWRALRVRATGVMQSGLRWGCQLTSIVALARRCARVVRSVACGQSCGVSPRPPLGFAAARPRAVLPVRPPRGLPLAARGQGDERSGESKAKLEALF